MTRPRVPDNKRQRTARACDSCKRRKQKCNGLSPCNTCVKRNLLCDYTDGRSPPRSSAFSTPTSRRRRYAAADAGTSAGSSIGPDTASTTPSMEMVRPLGGTSFEMALLGSMESHDSSYFLARHAHTHTHAHAHAHAHTHTHNHTHTHTPVSSEDGGSPHQSMMSETDDDEEIETMRQSRMLEDASSRLYYLGDSSSYSFVQLIRLIVDNAAGPSSFTVDPQRHKMLNSAVSPAETPMSACLLPAREVANLIVDSFFTNTHGLIEIFDRRSFDEYLDTCYASPSSAGSWVLCSVYLVLAVGLAMSAPAPASFEESVFERLQAEQPVGRAEALFAAAKTLVDPMSGAEEAELWVVQAWILMTVYLMITAKSTAAYSYCGLAVRLAYTMGIHRLRETMSLFSNVKEQIRLRRNIWRSLYILDRFLAASLGRPCAIAEDDCCWENLELTLDTEDDAARDAEEGFTSRVLCSAIKSARSLGHIIQGIYSKDVLSTKLAQSIIDECDLWSIKLHPSLSSSNIAQGRVDARRGMAILQIYLLHYHAIFLLTRPFFVHLMVRSQTSQGDHGRRRAVSKMEQFSQACVAASTWSISLIQAAFEAKYLPRRNPFVLYFLFSSAVVILSNQFSGLHQNNHFPSCMAGVFAVLDHCEQTDIQARRMKEILRHFYAALEEHLLKQRQARQQLQKLSSAGSSMTMGGEMEGSPLGSRRPSTQGTQVDAMVKYELDHMDGFGEGEEWEGHGRGVFGAGLGPGVPYSPQLHLDGL